MMEVDNNCLSNIDENTEDNQMEHSNSTPEQVTESGTAGEYNDVWNEFKCVFCDQDIKHVANPKLLPCLHTACEPCLTSEANSETSPSSSGAEIFFKSPENLKRKRKKRVHTKSGLNIQVKKFPNGVLFIESVIPSEKEITQPSVRVKQILCQACSQEVNLDDAVDHLFLMEYAQSSDSLPEESSYPCSCEEGNEGIAFCPECQEWLCESCVTAHHRVRLTKDHILRPKEEMEGENAAMRNQKYLTCPVHPKEQLKVYCESCDKLTCRDCQLSDHKAHKYQFLATACEEEKEHITELLTKIKEKQGHMEEASNSLNKRHEEIVEREQQISQEIQLFGIKFITDINRRAKALLQDLNKICSDKKNLLNVKTEELKSVAERLKHCQKFAEAAVSLGSETALVYSKKPIMNQLRRILRHKCDVPNPHQIVDIQFNYETNFLSQYISSLGQILVDSQPIPGSSANNAMLPMPQTIVQQQTPVPNAQPIRQVPQMQVNQRATLPSPMQQVNQQQQQVPYGQPQVTSSTDMVRNTNNQQMRMMNNYGRANHVQRGPVPNQQANFQMQGNTQYAPRQQMVHQQTPQSPMRQRAQQVQPQQQQQQIQQPPPYNSSQLPMPLRTNKNISVTTLPSPAGPSPSKQRAIAPRSNMNMNNQANMQRMNANQVNQARQSQPQLIVLDGEQKTPNMSNTTRLTHFPSNLAATLAANPSLQIQPATNNNYSNPALYGQQISLIQFPPVSSMLTQSSPNLVQHLIQPHPPTSLPVHQNVNTVSVTQTVNFAPLPVPSYQEMNPPPMSNVTPMSMSNVTPMSMSNVTPMSNITSMSNVTPMSMSNITPMSNISPMSNVTPMSVVNTSPSGYKLILPKQQNQNPSIVTTTSPGILASLHSDSVISSHIASLQQDDANDQAESSCLKQLLEKDDASGAQQRDCSSPDSSSSDSLPSLDSILNTTVLQTMGITTKESEKPNTPTLTETINDILRGTDSNSSQTTSTELSSAFQKSCRTTEDKCIVCKDGKNLISCCECDRHYHTDCHVPSLTGVKNVNNWVCMMCRDVLHYPIPEEDAKRKLIDLQGRELMTCERILLEIFIHPKSWYFHNKVSKKVPNYYKVIKKPMDLSTIRMKLSPTHFEHYIDAEGFCDDMRLIFRNCFIFNTEGSDVHNAGKEIEAFFEALLREYFPELTFSDAEDNGKDDDDDDDDDDEDND